MSNETPLVKDKAIDTLNAVINSLIYVVDTMPALERTVVQQTTSANDDDDQCRLLLESVSSPLAMGVCGQNRVGHPDQPGNKRMKK